MRFKLNMCTLMHLGYHSLFVGGSLTIGNHYIDELRRIEKSVVSQVDRAESLIVRLEDIGVRTNKSIDKISQTGDNLSNSVNNINKQLKSVKKACKFL